MVQLITRYRQFLSPAGSHDRSLAQKRPCCQGISVLFMCVRLGTHFSPSDDAHKEPFFAKDPFEVELNKVYLEKEGRPFLHFFHLQLFRDELPRLSV